MRNAQGMSPMKGRPMVKKTKLIQTDIRVKNNFRLMIANPDGTFSGDTGWQENQVVNTGFQNYLQFLVAASAGSTRATVAALGTGTVPATNATTLAGEIFDTNSNPIRCTLTTGTTGSTAVNYTFTLNSGIISAASTIQNVGLFNSTSAGTMFCGKTYATSQLATNQAVNGTYNITFS